MSLYNGFFECIQIFVDLCHLYTSVFFLLLKIKESWVLSPESSVHPILASIAPRYPNSCNLPHLCTVSSVSRSLDSNLTSIHVMSHLQPGPEFGVSPHSRSHVTSIQVTRIAHHLHPSPIPTFPCIKICSLTQSRSHRTPIHFLRLTSHLNLRS